MKKEQNKKTLSIVLAFVMGVVGPKFFKENNNMVIMRKSPYIQEQKNVNNELYYKVQSYDNGLIHDKESLEDIFNEIDKLCSANVDEICEFIKNGTIRGKNTHLNLQNIFDEGTDSYVVLKVICDERNYITDYLYSDNIDYSNKKNKVIIGLWNFYKRVTNYVYYDSPIYNGLDPINFFTESLNPIARVIIYTLGENLMKSGVFFEANVNGEILNLEQLQSLFGNENKNYRASLFKEYSKNK